MRMAILVDGGFFLKRYRYLYSKGVSHDPRTVAKYLHKGLLEHLKQKPARSELYRILFYDCPPLTKRVQNPISKRGFDFGSSTEAKFRLQFHEELKRLRKVALRLVEQIILVSGDSDFVPAAKLARREGIDFVLDPMWNHINPDLYEHIDGLQSTWPKRA